MSFHHYFSRQGNIPSHHIFTHPSTLSHYSLTCGSLCPQVLGSLLALFMSLVWMFHPLPAPCVSKLSSPRHFLESGILRGKFLQLLHSGELKSSISVNSVMAVWG